MTLLCRHVARSNAQTILHFALNGRALTEKTVVERDLATLIPLLERGVELFRGAQAIDALRQDLLSLVGAQAGAQQRTIIIRSEPQIAEARAVTRLMCETSGVRPFVMQKITTI